jgi:hypothetical protein
VARKAVKSTRKPEKRVASKYRPGPPRDVDPRGRPTVYTPEVADAILLRLRMGETLLDICETEGMPCRGTIHIWVKDDHEGFAARFYRDRDIGLDARADELLRISQWPREGTVETTTVVDSDENGRTVTSRVQKVDAVDRSRLYADNLKWYLSKLAARRYGDKLQLAGDGGGPIQVSVVKYGEDDE